jgi:hypothetical protein
MRPHRHVEASGQFQDQGQLRNPRLSSLDPKEVREVGLGRFGELSQGQSGFLATKCDLAPIRIAISSLEALSRPAGSAASSTA